MDNRGHAFGVPSSPAPTRTHPRLDEEGGVVKTVKRWSTLALGWAVVFAGLILIPLPGPGLLVIPVGLAILSLESVWAHTLLQRHKPYLLSRWPDVHARLERFQSGGAPAQGCLARKQAPTDAIDEEVANR